MYTVDIEPEEVDKLVVLGLKESLGYLLDDMANNEYHDEQEQLHNLKIIKALKRVIKYYGG
jgi:hypothetical protein